MDDVTLENGRTVEIGETFTLTYDSQQQGLPEGTELTVVDIEPAPDGVSIHFESDLPAGKAPLSEEYHGDPVMIYAFAMTELLTDGGLTAGQPAA